MSRHPLGGHDRPIQELRVETRPPIIHELCKRPVETEYREMELHGSPYLISPFAEPDVETRIKEVDGYAAVVWHTLESKVDEEAPSITLYGYYEVWMTWVWHLRGELPASEPRHPNKLTDPQFWEWRTTTHAEDSNTLRARSDDSSSNGQRDSRM